MKIASFDVDAQKGFTPLCPDELPISGGDEIASVLNAAAKRADLRIGSKDAHSVSSLWVVRKHEDMLKRLPFANADLTWVSHCVPGTKGFDLLEGLPRPDEYDFFIWKGIELDYHPYGACFHDLAEKLSTGVIEFLKGHRVKKVIIGGLALDYCVKNTALQLHRAGFEPIVVLEASRALATETGDKAVELMKNLGITVCNTLAGLDQILLD